jgi:hypothetical protein
MSLMTDPISGAATIVTGVKDILAQFFPDKSQEERDKVAAAIQLANQAAAANQAQADIEKVEAGQPGIHFRDGAGWVLVAGFAFIVLKAPIEWAAILLGHHIELPPVDSNTIVPMLGGLLGLGGMHVYQQVKS